MGIFGDKVAKEGLSDLIAPKKDTTQVDPEKTDEDYISEGLAKDYPDLAELNLPEHEFVDYIRRADFPDIKDDKKFNELLRKAYAPPRPSIGGIAKDFVVGAAKSIYRGAVGPVEAIARTAEGNQYESALNQMGDISQQDLLQRGYSPETAKHVMEQRIGTEQELAAGMQHAGEEGQKASIEGIVFQGGNAAFGGLESAMSKGIIGKLTQRGLGAAARHAVSGGGGFAAMEMARAAAEGKSAREIYDAGKEGFVTGVNFGLGMAYIARPVAKAFGQAVKDVGGGIGRYVTKQASLGAQRQVEALARQVDEFAEKFNGDWLRTRFEDLATDPTTGLPVEVPETILAARLLQRVLGSDALENASESAVAKMAEKIKIQRANVGLEPSSQRIAPPSTSMLPQMPGMQVGQEMVPMPINLPPPTPREAIDALITTNKQLQTMPHQGMEFPSGGQAPVSTDSKFTGEQSNPAMDPGSLRGQEPFIPGAQSKPDMMPPPPNTPGKQEMMGGKPVQTEPSGMQMEKKIESSVQAEPSTGVAGTLNPQPNITSPFQMENPEWESEFRGTYDPWAPTKAAGETSSPEMLADLLHGEKAFTGSYPDNLVINPRNEVSLPTISKEYQPERRKNQTPETRTTAETYKSFIENPSGTPLPYNAPKENTAPKGSHDWFINTFNDLRNGYVDLPNSRMAKSDYVREGATEAEKHQNLAHRRNKRTTAWHQAVASFTEMAATKLKDKDEAASLERDAQQILETRNSNVPTTDQEIKFADDLLDRVTAAMKKDMKNLVIKPKEIK